MDQSLFLNLDILGENRICLWDKGVIGTNFKPASPSVQELPSHIKRKIQDKTEFDQRLYWEYRKSLEVMFENSDFGDHFDKYRDAMRNPTVLQATGKFYQTEQSYQLPTHLDVNSVEELEKKLAEVIEDKDSILEAVRQQYYDLLREYLDKVHNLR